MTTTEQILIEKYGPLLSLDQLAEILKRSKNGLRLTIRGSSQFAQKVRACRKRMGRRVYFHSVMIGKLIDEADGECSA